MLSNLETKYSISINEKQENKHRRFFIKGRYTIEHQQDMHVYEHKEELDCYIVYKTNRMKALNTNNWDDCDTVLSIDKFDETKYEHIYGEQRIKENKIQNFSENLTNIYGIDLLLPLRYMNIFSLEDMWDNIDYICPIELAIQYCCQCQVNFISIFN